MKRLITFVLILLFLMKISAYGAELPKVKAQGACLMDYETGRVLYEKNMNEPLPMASTTKIMTCIIALESGKLEDIVTASSNAAKTPKVRLGLKKGEKHRLYDLLYPLMLISGNDCAVAIAEHIGGSIQGFADIMNKKAKEIGARDTEFVTPNGLDSGNHHSTAYDMALITRYALKNEKFRKIIATRQITIPLKNSDEKSYTVSSKNRLLNEFDGAIGVKTGFTGKAGNCFVGAAERNGLTLISVNLASGWGSAGKQQKWRDAKNMLNYGFDNYKKYKIAEKGKILGKANVTFSNTKEVPIVCDSDGYAVLTDEEYKDLKVHTDFKKNTDAPVHTGDLMGTMTISTDLGETLFKCNIVAANNAERFKFKDSFKRIMEIWFKNWINDYLKSVS
ncbi:MAG: D-alanyl-D-alanine carboxypeptidase [Clostridia bacterium]|nr:D-alanyl-D-alanine carboxypeptidase [Clostridia bacterium]